MEFATATYKDIDGVLALHHKYHVDSIDEADRKDGFVTTAFTREQLIELIEHERGLSVAKMDSRIVGYAMAASWGFWERWPMFAQMIKELPNYEYQGQKLNLSNSYQYGPICIDGSVRGSGAFEKLFDFSLQTMATRYPILVTFIHTTNTRSFVAHSRKLGLAVLGEFPFNNNRYYWLACSTR